MACVSTQTISIFVNRSDHRKSPGPPQITTAAKCKASGYLFQELQSMCSVLFEVWNCLLTKCYLKYSGIRLAMRQTIFTYTKLFIIGRFMKVYGEHLHNGNIEHIFGEKYFVVKSTLVFCMNVYIHEIVILDIWCTYCFDATLNCIWINSNCCVKYS